MSAKSISIGHGILKSQTSNANEGLVHGLKRWYTNYRTRRQLARLPDFMLKDIGVSRIDAEHEASKGFWKD